MSARQRLRPPYRRSSYPESAAWRPDGSGRYARQCFIRVRRIGCESVCAFRSTRRTGIRLSCLDAGQGLLRPSATIPADTRGHAAKEWETARRRAHRRAVGDAKDSQLPGRLDEGLRYRSAGRKNGGAQQDPFVAYLTREPSYGDGRNRERDACRGTVRTPLGLSSQLPTLLLPATPAEGDRSRP